MFKLLVAGSALLVATTGVAQTTRELTLDEALALAGARSEQVAIAQAGVKRAEANVARSESQRRPQINGLASYQRTLANQFSGIGGGGSQPPVPPECQGAYVPDASLPLEERVRLLEIRQTCPAASPFGGVDFSQLGFGSPNTWNFGLSGAWTLFTFGRLEAQVRAAEAARDVARTVVTSSQAQVRLDVTQAYFDAQLADELVSISETSLATSEETLRLTELRAEAGTQAEFDVLQARVARDNQRPILIRRRTQRDLAYDRLKLLIDIPLEQPLRLTTPVTRGVSRNVDTTLDPAARVNVQQARQRVVAAEQQLRAAKAERMPTISASSQVGLVGYSESFFPSDLRKNGTVGVSLQLPIYSGGRIAADVNAARADLDEAKAQAELALEMSRLDTASALAELHAARATWEATAGTVEQAQRGYELARLRYREGVSTQLEVDAARLQLEQARANRVQAARDLWVAETRVELLPSLPVGSSQSQGAAAAAQQPQQTPAGSMSQTSSFLSSPAGMRPATATPGAAMGGGP